MPPNSTIEMRFKITDDGSVVLDKLSSKLESVKQTGEKSFQELERSANKGLGGIKVASLIYIGREAAQMGERLYKAASETAAMGAELGKLAAKAGMSVEEFQKLKGQLPIFSEGEITRLSLAHDQMEQMEGKIKSLAQSLKTDFAAGVGAIADFFSRLASGQGLKDVVLEMQTLYAYTETGGAPKWVKDWVTESTKLEAMEKQRLDILQKTVDAEMKLNAYFADDAELLKQATREVEQRNKAMDLMEELGVKTKVGAEREVGSIEEKFKMLLGKGYSPEELAAAREKLTAQLQDVAKKYAQPAGWMTEGEEGGVQWHRNVPEGGLGADVGEMVKKSVEELERMQRAATEVAAPRTIMIDFQPVRDANEAALKLRETLDRLGEGIDIPVHISISGREGINTLEKIEEGLVTRIQNKQSKLGSIMRREIDGVIHYSND